MQNDHKRNPATDDKRNPHKRNPKIDHERNPTAITNVRKRYKQGCKGAKVEGANWVSVKIVYLTQRGERLRYCDNATHSKKCSPMKLISL